MTPDQHGSTRRDFLRHSTAGAAALALLASMEDYRTVSAQTNERNATMSKIKGTKTEANLLKAFAGESQARNRYTLFALRASEEGYEHVAAIFLETADHERVHAQQFFQYLDTGEGLEITATFPAGKIGTTEENLTASANGEKDEWEKVYPEFAKIANEEGFANIARTFEAVAIAEKQHEKRYRGFLTQLKSGNIFKRDNVVWRCRNCGFIAAGQTAPGVCGACKKPQGWFEILAENW
jgi:rubrerythrin